MARLEALESGTTTNEEAGIRVSAKTGGWGGIGWGNSRRGEARRD